ncbi:MAG: hypothetical protein HOV77_10570 [Hamadaea sp.]|uniref:hypothetical protein n=1 Tax=Hamadaea sp. TaxID=2024425 RepID=UPI001859C8B7|nr:hypothetical protein [Hamadaea sp.]NUT19621.1 hypothetical protein [Hamadaea sp.]
MAKQERSAALDRLLDRAYADGGKLSTAELRAEAEREKAPSGLLARLDLVPEGEYTREGLLKALPDEDADLWRDPESLPLSELDRALATYSSDGQADDVTGGDAGAEEEFGETPWALQDHEKGDPDPDSVEGMRLRPSPEGRTGPG